MDSVSTMQEGLIHDRPCNLLLLNNWAQHWPLPSMASLPSLPPCYPPSFPSSLPPSLPPFLAPSFPLPSEYDVECFLLHGNGTVVFSISCLSLAESLLTVIVHVIEGQEMLVGQWEGDLPMNIRVRKPCQHCLHAGASPVDSVCVDYFVHRVLQFSAFL